MLRFFRKYILNKWVLIILGSVLMVVFLVQDQLMQMLGGASREFEIGTVAGESITNLDEQRAAYELQMLRSLPIIASTVPDTSGDNARRWMLLMRDAERLGLSASVAEVNTVLNEIGLTEDALAEYTKQYSVQSGTLRNIVGRWIMAKTYEDLVAGRAHTPPSEKVALLAMSSQLAQGGDRNSATQLALASTGSPRLSQPLATHYFRELQSTVSGRFVLVEASRYLDRVGEPSEEKMRELFEQYKDNLPGRSEPYGFGYRSPDRFKVEYMSIPLEDCLEQVEVDEADAIAFFKENAADFAEEGAAPSYAEARAEVVERMRVRAALELAEQMVKKAQAIMFESERSLPQQDGYRVLGDDFRPTPLRLVADELAQEFGVRPRLYRETDEWTELFDFNELPELGTSVLLSRNDVSAIQYVASALEFGNTESELAPLGLQVGLASLPLVSYETGSPIILRLTAVEPATSPETLDAVRDDVRRDAKLLLAYDTLQQERDTWLGKARDRGLDSLAGEVGGGVETIDELSLRVIHPQTGELVVPWIEGVGQSEALLNSVIEVATGVDGELADQPAADRTGATAIDYTQSLAVFVVDDYAPGSRAVYRQAMSSPRSNIGPQIQATLLRSRSENPMSLDTLSARVDFVSDEPQPEEDEEVEAEAGEMAEASSF